MGEAEEAQKVDIIAGAFEKWSSVYAGSRIMRESERKDCSLHDKVMEILSRVLARWDDGSSTSLTMDSFESVELVLELENAFGITFTYDEFACQAEWSCSTLAIEGIIARKLSTTRT